MRGFRSPAAARRFALVLLATTALLGCGATPPTKAHASAAAKVTTRPAPAQHAAVDGSGTGSDRLAAIAFVSKAAGYGMFTRQAGGRCQMLAGRTADGGASFGTLAAVTRWPCGGTLPATTMAADSHGDVFLYDPGFYVSHDGARIWAPGGQPGTVLAVETAGRSAWMVRAGCPRRGSTCPLQLLESAAGGRTGAPSPAEPPGATVRDVGGQPAQEGAASQTWLLRTGRSSAYVLSGPAGDAAPFWFTGDGGKTWSTGRVRCGRIGAISATLAAAPDGTLLAVCAGQPSAGFQAKSAARSTDGGRSWTVHTPCPVSHMTCLPLDFGYLGQIAAVSADTAFLTGDRSSLLVTTDGGSRWRDIRPQIGDSGGGTFGVIFVNRRYGFVLGDDARRDERPAIWRTTDGGARWSAVVPRAG